MTNTKIAYPVYELCFFTGFNAHREDSHLVIHRTGIRPLTGRSAEALCRLVDEHAFGRVNPHQFFLAYIGSYAKTGNRGGFTPFQRKLGRSLIEDHTWSVPMVMPLTWDGHEVPIGIPVNPRIYDWTSSLNAKNLLVDDAEYGKTLVQECRDHYVSWLAGFQINNLEWFTDKVFEESEVSN